MSNSCTDVFYSLLDLNEEEKLIALAKLENTQPLVYQQVAKLFNGTNQSDLSLTQVFSRSASDVFEDACFAGEELDKYHIGEELGRGGMGVVYAATRRDNTYEQDLAIKFIQPSLTDILGKKALYDEAQLLARLNHPCIAKVFDAGEYQGYVYMVMEKIQGQNIVEYINTQHPSLKEILHLFESICDALEHAHQNQILHGDIKPQNILVDERGLPKVFDFNITQIQQAQGIDTPSIKAFSQHFASPEQRRGDYLSQQSDVYSLGQLLATLLHNTSTSDELNAIIEKSTQQQPNCRYKHVAALRKDVQNILAHRPISARRNTFGYAMRKLVQRRPVSCALTAGLVISAVSFSSLLYQQNQQLRTEQALTQEMMLELTNIVFYSKNATYPQEIDNMLALTQRKVLANRDIPPALKQKMLMAMVAPVPPKAIITQSENSL